MSSKKKNAFSLFVDHVREEEEAKGNKTPENYKEMIEFVSVKWKELSEMEKQEYKNLAKANKGQNGDRLDCTGRSITEVEREDQERAQREPRMLSYIETRLKELKTIEDIVAEKFYVISFNVFCVTIKNQFLAAEVGLVEYSIKEGITRQFQCFIDPGPIPVGYASACRQISETTHQIPIGGYDDKEEEEVDLVKRTEVMAKIVEFIDGNLNLDEVQPIYCVTQELYQTKFILEHLQVGLKQRFDFYVIDFACLFLKLFQKVYDQMISVGIVRDLLRKTIFTFNVNSCCDYHWEKDNPQYCALCVVKCSCFILSDHICEGYGIVPIFNQHLPEKPTDETITYTLVSSGSSSCQSRASISRPSSRASISRPSSRASVSRPSSQASLESRNLYDLTFRPVSAEPKEVTKELTPLHIPETSSFTSYVTAAAPFSNVCDHSEGGWSKPPMSTSVFASVVEMSLPKDFLSDLYDGHDSGFVTISD